MVRQLIILIVVTAGLFTLRDLGIFAPVAGLMGRKGVLIFIFLMIFFICYRNSVSLFQWVEDRTYGTRDYILNKLELLHIEVEPNRITFMLLFLSFGMSVILFCAFALMGSIKFGIFIAIVFSILGWQFPKPFVDFLVNKRINLYENQMVDGLNLLSNGLRAGMSLPQSIGLVVDELPAPISQEFNLILQQTKIGVPLEEAMNNMSERIPTQDNEMFVVSVGILRETGGNLAEVFDTIIDVIRDRIKIKQKIATYTAQGKFQAFFMGFMPFGMLMMNYSQDPKLMTETLTHPVGIILVAIACILDFIGLFIILKIVNIKV